MDIENNDYSTYSLNWCIAYHYLSSTSIAPTLVHVFWKNFELLFWKSYKRKKSLVASRSVSSSQYVFGYVSV